MGKFTHNRSKNNKILLVSNSTWNIYNFRTNLISYFSKIGYSIYVAAPVDSYLSYLNQLSGITHIPLNNLVRDSKNPISNYKSYLELKKIYKQVKPDLVLQFTIKPNILGSIAANRLGIPSISVVTGLGYTFIKNGWLTKLTKILYKFSFKKSKFVVFENPDDQDLFIKARLIKPSQASLVSGCGIDTMEFSPTNKEQASPIVFSFVGRLLYDKGIREFVEAAKVLSSKKEKIEFWVIGDVDIGNPSSVTRSDLMQWVNDKTIVYKGAKDDVKPLISMSDCIVLPSYREGLPKVLLEAMAMAKPIITTNTPGCKETVIHNENGYLVRQKSHSELTMAMECILSLNIIEREKMGRKSRKIVLEKFRDEIVTMQYGKLTEAVVSLSCSKNKKRKFRNSESL